MRRPVACVIGSGSQSWSELTEPLGALLAGAGVHLLTGAGGGVMETVSKAFQNVSGRAGLVIGVAPGSISQELNYAPRAGYPNPHVEIVIRTHLPLSGERGKDTLSRNHVNILSADVIVGLPGGEGTRCEAELAIHYHKPILLLGPDEAFTSFPSRIERTSDLGRVASFIAASVGC